MRRLVACLPALVAVGTVTLVISGCSWLNSPPAASFRRTPASGEAPLSVFFDASASSDADGTIASYAWRFGDGASGSDATTTHTFRSAGEFSVGLTVTDDRGANASSTRMVVVREPGEAVPVGTGVGEAAPDFTLEDLAGHATSLSELRGYVVLLDFWASGCPPCAQTLPYLESLRQRYASEGLVLVGVSLDDRAEDIARFVAATGCSGMIALWESRAAAEQVKTLFNVSDIPRTFVIDRQGVIRWVNGPIFLRDRDITPWL